jgi:hypothetical protein
MVDEKMNNFAAIKTKHKRRFWGDGRGRSARNWSPT